MNPLNSTDPGLTEAQIDRRYSADTLRRHLRTNGVHTVTTSSGNTFRLNDVVKGYVVKAYMDAIKGDAKTEGGNVKVERRVLLTGGDCFGQNGHVIALVCDDDKVVVYSDADDTDGEKFHTTLSDLKAAVTALEGLS